MANNLFISSFDWFSGSGTFLGTLVPDSFPGFKCDKQKLSTKVFKEWWVISQRGFPVMDLLLKPSTPILKQDTCHFKISNFKLYQYHGAESNFDFFKTFNITNAHATRIDVCIDFNMLLNNINPADFIKRISRGIYLRKYSGRFKVEGTQAKNPDYHYLRYGSHSSPVSLYFYNKSKELKEKKLKPWITEMWKHRGLDLSRDVWRMEFSVKDTRLRFVDKSTGEGFGIHDVSFLKKTQLTTMLNACINRYGSFVINNWKSNISRMKPIQIIPGNFTDFTTFVAIPSFESSNLQKFTIKQLSLLEQDLRLNKQLQTEHILQSISDYEKQFKLEGYHKKITGQ
jgi:hypothetical protein